MCVVTNKGGLRYMRYPLYRAPRSKGVYFCTVNNLVYHMKEKERTRLNKHRLISSTAMTLS